MERSSRSQELRRNKLDELLSFWTLVQLNVLQTIGPESKTVA